jgi:hypothetical protein
MFRGVLFIELHPSEFKKKRRMPRNGCIIRNYSREDLMDFSRCKYCHCLYLTQVDECDCFVDLSSIEIPRTMIRVWIFVTLLFRREEHTELNE